MMSEKLFSVDFWKNQKIMCKKKGWAVGITAAIFFLYYVVYITIQLTSMRAYQVMLGAKAENVRQTLINSLSSLAGLRQSGFVLVICVAILLAFFGFKYLFKREEIDFYESQPVSRKYRFISTVINGILVFCVFYFGSLFITILISCGLGAMSKVLFAELVWEAFRMLFLFLAVYSISIFAIMVTGNLPIAMLLTAFLLLIEYAYSYMINVFEIVFFKSFNSLYNPVKCLLSPVFYAENGKTLCSGIFTYSKNLNSDILGQMVSVTFPGDIVTFIIGIAVMIISYYCYKNRKAEWAGKSIIYNKLSGVIKIAFSVCVSLIGGYIIYSLYETGDSKLGLNIMPIAMTLITIVACGGYEAIMRYSFKAFVKKWYHMIIAVVIMLAFFMVFRYDLIGYDSFTPDVTRLDSYTLNMNVNSDYTDDDGSYIDNMVYYDKYMFLTDFDDMYKVVDSSIEEYKNLPTDGFYYTATIMYRMKNGKKIYRNLVIPYDIDKKVMDNIIGSDEFKQGYFVQYNDEKIRTKAEKGGKLTYTNDNGTTTIAGSFYSEIADCYLKDLANFNFSLVSSKPCIGKVEYNNYSNNSYDYICMEIYPEYTNTIKSLKDNGLYLDEGLDVSQISRIEVSNYYPGYASYDEVPDDYDYSQQSSMDYTDEAQLKEILDSSISYSLLTAWMPSNFLDSKYGISAFTTGDYANWSRGFLRGQEPQFVIDDLGQ